ncbi:MAG: hypothetical protein K8F91_06310 [Candidatus Obscuribacterales bacterium]|nr:hypothetical protein [Candidatus Obscuribacterales bacterium]
MDALEFCWFTSALSLFGWRICLEKKNEQEMPELMKSASPKATTLKFSMQGWLVRLALARSK